MSLRGPEYKPMTKENLRFNRRHHVPCLDDLALRQRRRFRHGERKVITIELADYLADPPRPLVDRTRGYVGTDADYVEYLAQQRCSYCGAHDHGDEGNCPVADHDFQFSIDCEDDCLDREADEGFDDFPGGDPVDRFSHY